MDDNKIMVEVSSTELKCLKSMVEVFANSLLGRGTFSPQRWDFVMSKLPRNINFVFLIYIYINIAVQSCVLVFSPYFLTLCENICNFYASLTSINTKVYSNNRISIAPLL